MADDPQPRMKRSIRPLLGLLVLIACFVFVGFHFNEAAHFLSLIQHADPKWVALAIVFQVLTYVCSGAAFYEIVRAAKHRAPLGRMMALSVERMSVNQLAPAAGLSGHLYIFLSMRRLGLPRGVAAEAVFIDTLSFYIAYAVAVVLVLGMFLGLGEGDPLIMGGLILFLFVSASILLGIFWLFTYTDRELPKWMSKVPLLKQVAQSLRDASPERVQAPWVLGITSLYTFAIFALDGATLWAVMHMIGAPIEPMAAFAVFILASIAGSLSLLPGGVGGFEAASVLALRHFDVELGAALTATLLLRGLTLWFPLIPGSILAAKYVAEKEDYT